MQQSGMTNCVLFCSSRETDLHKLGDQSTKGTFRKNLDMVQVAETFTELYGELSTSHPQSCRSNVVEPGFLAYFLFFYFYRCFILTLCIFVPLCQNFRSPSASEDSKILSSSIVTACIPVTSGTLSILPWRQILRTFCCLYPMGLPAPISCHAWTQAATQFIYNSHKSSLIRKAICIFCKVHLHSQGFLFLFMLNSHTAKKSILGVPSCHSLFEHKVNNLSWVLQLDYLSWSIPAAPHSLD